MIEAVICPTADFDSAEQMADFVRTRVEFVRNNIAPGFTPHKFRYDREIGYPGEQTLGLMAKDPEGGGTGVMVVTLIKQATNCPRGKGRGSWNHGFLSRERHEVAKYESEADEDIPYRMWFYPMFCSEDAKTIDLETEGLIGESGAWGPDESDEPAKEM